MFRHPAFPCYEDHPPTPPPTKKRKVGGTNSGAPFPRKKGKLSGLLTMMPNEVMSVVRGYRAPRCAPSVCYESTNSQLTFRLNRFVHSFPLETCFILFRVPRYLLYSFYRAPARLCGARHVSNWRTASQTVLMTLPSRGTHASCSGVHAR